MLNFHQITLRRGTRVLLEEQSFRIERANKVGFTGANGCGKSSLFSVILGELQLDSGEFSMPQNLVVAHVAQHTPDSQQAAIEFVIDGDRELRQLQARIKEAERQEDGETLAHLYAQLESIDGYRANSRAAKLLNGLGFSIAEQTQSVNQFSGGWRMRLNLAQALMCRSDLLLLDEPTNHLDLEAVIWLEEWLVAYKGTLLLISHDKDFLDKVTLQIAHIERLAISLYQGNYSKFEILRAEQLARHQSIYEKQQREIDHMQRFITRFKAKASKAKQAQSRVKALQRIAAIGPAHVDSPFNFQFFKPDKNPNTLLSLEKVSIGYLQKPILSDVNFSILAGQRIGLLGVNGAGKSTLIKLLAQQLEPLCGTFTTAKDIQIGYFAQHQVQQLDLNASPLLHLQRLSPNSSEKELRGYLGGFDFRDERATQVVKPLSGGERARLVLALIVFQRPNLLLLDEPTNHLDLEMRHALSMALQEFEGAVLLVSHDRYLLRTVTDQFFLAADGKLCDFDGDLDDYYQWVKESNKTIVLENTTSENSQAGELNKKQIRQQAADQRKKVKSLRDKLRRVEVEMDKLNQAKIEIEQRLTDVNIYTEAQKNNLSECLKQQTDIKSQLSLLEEQWFTLSDEMENQQGSP